MPQGRSKAFSGKAKKTQIQAKRNRGSSASRAGVFSRNFLVGKGFSKFFVVILLLNVKFFGRLG
jgi:hypothetical protein